MPREARGKARDWVLTLFSEDWLAKWRDAAPPLEIPDERVRYLCGQVERCPTTGREHVQAFVRFFAQQRLTALRNLFGNGRYEIRRADTPEEAREYTKKEDTRVCAWREAGEWISTAGQRTDLQRARQMIQGGACLNDLFREEETFETAVRYHRGLQAAVQALHLPMQRDEVHVTVFHGPAGTGKTSAVRQLEEEAFWPMPPNCDGGAQWFDGYEGQQAVVFDDYSGEMPWGMLLRLLDRYPMRVPTKHGSVPWQATRIYLTSNVPPASWHPGKYFEPLSRRIHRQVLCEQEQWTVEKNVRSL